ncbi:MAG: DUF58 domain-containing protein [Chitinivibrionales bacterium]|nr:DUF58 domain-containing protein [Chitinivibrionales bacterium]
MDTDITTLFDEQFLKKLEKVKLLTKKGLRGEGVHQSGLRGEGMEFLDYRNYQPGDDVRYVDWNVYGRLQKLYIKQFSSHAYQSVHLLLDSSGSMNAGVKSKAHAACTIAALLSYLFLANGDRVTIIPFSNRLWAPFGPIHGNAFFPQVMRYLQKLESSGETGIAEAMNQYCVDYPRKHDHVILVSDLLDSKGYAEGLKYLAYQKSSVEVIQILNNQDRRGVGQGYFLLQDCETGKSESYSIDASYQQRYAATIDTYVHELESLCTTYRMHYVLYDTSVPFESFIIDFITQKMV